MILDEIEILLMNKDTRDIALYARYSCTLDLQKLMESLEDQEMKEKVEVMRNLQEVILELKVHGVGLQLPTSRPNISLKAPKLLYLLYLMPVFPTVLCFYSVLLLQIQYQYQILFPSE